MPEHLDRSRTPLLTLITLESLDEDYVVAGRRRDSGPSTPRRTPRVAAMTALLIFGLLVAVAAVQKSRDAGVDDASRDSLIGRIKDARAEVGKAEQRLADLRDETTRADHTLTSTGTALASAQQRGAELGALTGFRPVSGPALRVVLDSSPYADVDNRVRDSDIAQLVNALWGAGAEAITVNGQRVTARTGIRTSGSAIEVNGVGIAPPYTILAIGNTDDMSANFLDSPSGQDFVTLADQYDFRYDVHDVGQVQMPAAPATLTHLRAAQAVGGTRGSKSGKTTRKVTRKIKDKRG